jgi:Tol biopolymer transport system component
MRDWARLRPWSAVGLAAWLVVGVALVGRADRFGLVADIGFSPYHLVGYAGLAVLGAYSLVAIFRGLRGGSWLAGFPPRYGGLGLGFLAIVGWVVFDAVWRSAFGINSGIENGFAPTRILIPLGLVLVASGPLLEALDARARNVGAAAERQRQAPVIGTLPAAIAVGLIGAAVAITPQSPIRDPWNDVTIADARDSSEIWTMAADGSGQTRVLEVLESGIDYSLPAWSPDGSRIAFTIWSNLVDQGVNTEIDDQSAAIWTMAADGSDLRLVVDGAPGQAWIPTWLPDGRIAYTYYPGRAADQPGAAQEPQANAPPGAVGPPTAGGGSEIWVVEPDGSGATKLIDASVGALGAVWSADGDSIAYIVDSAGAGDLRLASVTGSGASGARALASDPANDWGPAWSPDGSRVAFVSDRSGNDDVWVVGVDGSALVQLTTDPGGDWVPAWSPDGSRIAFVSERGGDVEVWSMAADGSDLRNLTANRATRDGQWSVAWSPDGMRLAYASASYGDPQATGWVREDLAVFVTILYAVILAAVALLAVALGPPFGAFTVIAATMAAVDGVISDQWRFLLPVVAAGLLVDVLVRLARPGWRPWLAAATFPGLVVLSIGLTLKLGAVLAWSNTLLLGVAVTAAIVGLGIAAVTRRTGWATRPA